MTEQHEHLAGESVPAADLVSHWAGAARGSAAASAAKTTWWHGTTGEYAGPPTVAARRHGPSSHWNCDLGLHVAADWEVAASFAEFGEVPTGRVCPVEVDTSTAWVAGSEFAMSDDLVMRLLGCRPFDDSADGWAYLSSDVHRNKALMADLAREDLGISDYLGPTRHLPGIEQQEWVVTAERSLHQYATGAQASLPPAELLDTWLTQHPIRADLTSWYASQLRGEGVGVVVYLNEYERGLEYEKRWCALVLDDARLDAGPWDYDFANTPTPRSPEPAKPTTSPDGLAGLHGVPPEDPDDARRADGRRMPRQEVLS